jgi:hypothetical protein
MSTSDSTPTSGTAGRTPRRGNGQRRRGRTTAAFVVLLAAPLLTVVGPAGALDADRVGPVDRLQRGFPAYYTDNSGFALQMCDDGSANCLLARPRDLRPPEGEALYWAAFADLNSPGMELSVELAVEAAWLGREQVVFDRVRVRGHVNAAGSYTLTYPYGTMTIQAEAPSEQRNIDFTEDIGCEPVAGGRCNFRVAAGRRGHITTWLRSTRSPRRYMGNPERRTPVTGGIRQFVRVSGPAGTATTNRWGVLGKRANSHAVSLPRRHRFGNVRGRKRDTVRVQNIGTRRMTIRRMRIRGDRTLRGFNTGRNSCRRGEVLSIGEACRIGVRYRPDGRRRSTARMIVTDDVRSRTVRLRARTAAVFRARHRVHFSARPAGTSGITRRVVVRNAGAIAMRIRGVHLRGGSRSSFDRRSGSPRICARGVRLPAGGRCAVYVGFEPQGFGTKRARIIVRSNALRGHPIRLVGRAR